MKISEFKDSYPDSSSLPTATLLNKAVHHVLEEKGLDLEEELTADILHEIYLTISHHRVRMDIEVLLIAGSLGENTPEMALRVINRTKKEVFGV